MNKLTLSVSRDVAERAKARARRLGSLSAVVEDFLWTLDGEGLPTFSAETLTWNAASCCLRGRWRPVGRGPSAPLPLS